MGCSSDGLQRLVDIQKKLSEGKGRGYEQWAKIHNLKQAAKTLSVYQEYGFSSPEELDEALTAANAEMQDSLSQIKTLESTIREKKELQRHVLDYAATKSTRDGLKEQKSDKARRAYREKHESDFIIADAAKRYFKSNGIEKLPSSKKLQAEINSMTTEKNGIYNTYREQRERVRELQTVKSNIDHILRREQSQQKKHEIDR